MYNTVQRLSSAGSLAMTVFFSLLLAVSVSSFALLPSSVTGGSLNVQPLTVVMGRTHQFAEEQEYGFASFDAKADLSPLFNWNTKQLFLQLTAEYQTASTIPNHFVLWDKLVLSPSQAHLEVENTRIKYPFKEVSRSFSDVSNVTYVLSYHLMPYVGFLTKGEVARSKVALDKVPKVKQRI